MSYDVARLLQLLIEPWPNSTPFFDAVAFCTSKIDDLKTTYSACIIPPWRHFLFFYVLLCNFGFYWNYFRKILIPVFAQSGLASKNLPLQILFPVKRTRMMKEKIWCGFWLPLRGIQLQPMSIVSYISIQIWNILWQIFSYNCHNPNNNTTSTQQLGWTRKWLCIHPPTHTNSTAASVSIRTTLLTTTKYDSNNKQGYNFNNNNNDNRNSNLNNNFYNKRTSI